MAERIRRQIDEWLLDFQTKEILVDLAAAIERAARNCDGYNDSLSAEEYRKEARAVKRLAALPVFRP